MKMPHGPQVMRKAAAAITYEYIMFKNSCSVLEAARSVKGRKKADTATLQNMAVECALLHARNLRDFFLSQGTKDDIQAGHFVQKPPRPKLGQLRSKSLRDRISKKLSHATYARSRLPKNWPMGKIESEIDGAMSSFLQGLSQEDPKTRKWFKIDVPGR